jgi:hypothetical protein
LGIALQSTLRLPGVSPRCTPGVCDSGPGKERTCFMGWFGSRSRQQTPAPIW